MAFMASVLIGIVVGGLLGAFIGLMSILSYIEDQINKIYREGGANETSSENTPR